MTDTDDTAKLWELIKTVEVAMLVTEDGGHLRSRPMAVSQKEFKGSLWFFTRASSHKVTEVEHDQRVNLAYAHPGKQDFVSVSGTAKLQPQPCSDRRALVGDRSGPGSRRARTTRRSPCWR